MASKLTGNYIALLKQESLTDKTIEIRNQKTGELVHNFQADYIPSGRIEFYKPEGLIAFVSGGLDTPKVEVYRLDDTTVPGSFSHTKLASLDQKLNGEVSYGSYGNITFDNEGNIWHSGVYAENDTYGHMNIHYYKPNEDFTSYVDGGEVGYPDTMATNVWENNYDGTECVFVEKTNQIWVRMNAIDNASESGPAFLIVDVATKKLIDSVDLPDDLGFTKSSTLSFYQNYATTQSDRTRNTVSYNKHRNMVIALVSNSINTGAANTHSLIGIDVDSKYAKVLLNTNKFMKDVNDKKDYYGVASSVNSGRIALFSSTHCLWTNVDNSMYSFFQLTGSTENNRDISVNVETEEIIAGNIAGFNILDNQGGTIASQGDLINIHSQACFINNNVNLPSGISSPILVKNPNNSPSDTTPEFIIKLRNSPVGTAQKIMYVEGTDTQLNDDTLDYTYNGWELKYDVSVNGSYSTNYNPANDSGDWLPINGNGLVKTSETVEDIYVKWELPEQEVKQHKGRIFIY
jgi:hypothetical protein